MYQHTKWHFVHFFLYGGGIWENHKSSDTILRANAGLNLLLGATSDLLYPEDNRLYNGWTNKSIDLLMASMHGNL